MIYSINNKVKNDSMRKKAFLFIAFLLAIAQGAWADGFGGGSGSIEDPYIISTTDHWNELASNVNAGNRYSGQFFKMGDDITVTTMVGIPNNWFSGDFNGDNHTLTFNYGTAEAPYTEKYCAPFFNIDGASIHDLHVAGDIYTANKFASGLVAFSDGNLYIYRCRVSVNIHSSVDGDGTHGGFLARTTYGQCKIEDSVFDGSMTGSSTHHCGGFVGWLETSSLDKRSWVKIKNCLFAPTSMTFGSEGSATLGRGNAHSLYIDIDFYYTTPLGSTNGTKVNTSAPADLYSTKKTIAGVDFYLDEWIVFGFTVSSSTPKDATIGWSAYLACWGFSLRYRQAGSDGDWTTIDNANDEGTYISGLQSDIIYEYQVGYYYQGKHYYSHTQTFATAPRYVAPSGLSVNEATATAATLLWTGYADTYNVQYRSYVQDENGNIDYSGWTIRNGVPRTTATLTALRPGTSYMVQVQSVVGENTSDWTTLYFTTPAFLLADDADNSALIEDRSTSFDVTLADRTLYRDGSWNTLCLPFAVSDFTGTPLEGATVKTLSSSSFSDGTLTLNFTDANSIEAGKPYIVKWATASDNIKDPTFQNVTISSTVSPVTTGYVNFSGWFSPFTLEADDKSVLYLGADNKLYYPSADKTVNSCRAVFRLKGIEAGDLPQQARRFVLNFGDGETTRITLVDGSGFGVNGSDAWYTIDGRRLNGKPAARGLYINNGNKVVIK